MRGMRSAAVALGAAVAFVGCGGGGGDRLSKADYIKEADKICAASSAETDEITPPEAEEDVGAYFETAGKVVKAMLKDLRALNGPKDDEATVDSIYDDYENVLDEILDDPIAALSIEDDPFIEVGKRAQEYGFQECGAE